MAEARKRRIEPNVEADDAAPAKPTTRPSDPRPLVKRGWFWFAVIVAEVLVAWGLSAWRPSSPPQAQPVDLTGVDLKAFCAKAKDINEQGQSAPQTGDNVVIFETQQRTLRELQSVAPPDLSGDIQKLADSAGELADYSRELVAKEPDQVARLSKMYAKIQSLDSKNASLGKRLDDTLQRGCGMNFSEPAPGSIPGTAPTTSR